MVDVTDSAQLDAPGPVASLDSARLLAYCAALLLDPADPVVAMTLGIIERMTAPPVVVWGPR